MAIMQIHNIIDADARIKHFDDFSVISLSINTQGKYQKANRVRKTTCFSRFWPFRSYPARRRSTASMLSEQSKPFVRVCKIFS